MLSNLEQALALHLLPGCGSGFYWSLKERFGSLDAALSRHVDSVLANTNETARPLLNDFVNLGQESALYEQVMLVIKRCASVGVQLISFDEIAYPNLLKNTDRAPPFLYVKGDETALSLPQIAIVGSRNASSSGKEIAREFAGALCQGGFTVTSGLALGIDGEAHRGALESGGRTVAVLGSGLLRIYPHRHKGLAEKILNLGGAIVSEFPLDTAPVAHNFPRRNRIVSGLSCGTLVIEAARKSGSLITAKHALEQGREVFAVPGCIRNPNAGGCNAMIKSGAKLVESPRDIVRELGSMLSYYDEETSSRSFVPAPAELGELNESNRAVLDTIDYQMTSLDLIAGRCKKSIDEIASVLVELELLGLIENTGLGYVKR